MATVVPEMVHLAEDLGLVRDLGRYEGELVHMRSLMIDLQQSPTATMQHGWNDEQLVHETIGVLALLQARLFECRRRGLLG